MAFFQAQVNKPQKRLYVMRLFPCASKVAHFRSVRHIVWCKIIISLLLVPSKYCSPIQNVSFDTFCVNLGILLRKMLKYPMVISKLQESGNFFNEWNNLHQTAKKQTNHQNKSWYSLVMVHRTGQNEVRPNLQNPVRPKPNLCQTFEFQIQ